MSSKKLDKNVKLCYICIVILKGGDVVTLQKVAKKAGVSVSTASKALSDSKEVSTETRQLVIDAAKQLGYFEKTKKRRLTNRRKTAVTYAIMCPEIISVHYSELVTALCRRIDEKGGKASVFITEFDTEKKKTTIERCLSEKDIDAVICLEGIKDLDVSAFPLPIVFTVNQKDAYSVFQTVESGIDKAVKYLVESGHKKIAYAGEPLTESKRTAFCNSMQKYLGFYDNKFIFEEDGRFEISGKRIAERILGMEERPSAVVAAYDEIAYGLMHTLNNGGLNIPEDVSVVGINDIPTSKYLSTPLTTVRCDPEVVAEKALLFLDEQLLGISSKSRSYTVECELIIRESTKSLI